MYSFRPSPAAERCLPQITDVSQRVGAFALDPGSADAALVARLVPGAYTAQVTSQANDSGVVLVEVYDATNPPSDTAPKLLNVSTRGYVDAAHILIAGIVVNGTAPKKLLIRAVGPALRDYGITEPLADPKLQLYQNSTIVRENDNWSDSPDAAAIATATPAVGAFPLAAGSKDAAMLIYLEPGTYTAQVSGVGGAQGIALVEAYEVP